MKAPAEPDHKVRIVALEDETAAALYLSGKSDKRTPDRDALLAEMARRIAGESGRANGIHVHEVVQADLAATRPWPIKHGREDIAVRVVDHLQRVLDDDNRPVEMLGQNWSIFRGIETAADAYTARIQKRLPAEVRERLTAEGKRTGDPIMELPPGVELLKPWRDSPELLARSMEPRAILYGAIDEKDYTSLLWLRRGDDVPEAILSALEQWRSVLASRPEFRDGFSTRRVLRTS